MDADAAGRRAFIAWCREEGLRGRIVAWDWADMSAKERRMWEEEARQATADGRSP